MIKAIERLRMSVRSSIRFSPHSSIFCFSFSFFRFGKSIKKTRHKHITFNPNLALVHKTNTMYAKHKDKIEVPHSHLIKIIHL